MIAPRAAAVSRRGAALVAALGVALLVRVAIGGSAPAASAPAAVAFSAVLVAAVVAASARRPRWRVRDLGLGVAGGAALVALSLLGLPAVHIAPRAAAGVLAWWAPMVTVVAATEELVLRGVLFDAVSERGGDVAAVTVTALLFALIHLPLYGMGALGLDLCVGVFLGCLRVVSGNVAAPLVAHVLADLATGWLG